MAEFFQHHMLKHQNAKGPSATFTQSNQTNWTYSSNTIKKLVYYMKTEANIILYTYYLQFDVYNKSICPTNMYPEIKDNHKQSNENKI